MGGTISVAIYHYLGEAPQLINQGLAKSGVDIVSDSQPNVSGFRTLLLSVWRISEYPSSLTWELMEIVAMSWEFKSFLWIV